MDDVAALSTVMLLYLWGSCIAYLVIIGDSFSPLLKMAVGEQMKPIRYKPYRHRKPTFYKGNFLSVGWLLCGLEGCSNS